MNIEIIKESFTLKVNDQNYRVEFERRDHLSPWTMRIVNVDRDITLYTRMLIAEMVVNAELAEEIIEAYTSPSD